MAEHAPSHVAQVGRACRQERIAERAQPLGQAFDGLMPGPRHAVALDHGLACQRHEIGVAQQFGLRLKDACFGFPQAGGRVACQGFQFGARARQRLVQ